MTQPDVVTELETGLMRVIAPNPSMMTYWGTNTYILGTGPDRVLIDPGPEDPQHAQAIVNALPANARISHILVTHAHKDHSAGAAQLSKTTGASVYAFGDALSGRSDVMAALAEESDIGGGEGVDLAFQPDVRLQDGAAISTPAGDIAALHTPGHMGNHLCFAWNNAVFTGDLIMGWSSSLISPPDGDAAAFRESCQKLLARQDCTLFPGHGDPVESGHQRIQSLLDHRAQREAQILDALTQATLTLSQTTRAVYGALDPFTHRAAMRNTFAHLIDLKQQSKITANPNLSETAVFHRPNTKV